MAATYRERGPVHIRAPGFLLDPKWSFLGFSSLNTPFVLPFRDFGTIFLGPRSTEKFYKSSSLLGVFEDFWRSFHHLLPQLRGLRRSTNYHFIHRRFFRGLPWAYLFEFKLKFQVDLHER